MKVIKIDGFWPSIVVEHVSRYWWIKGENWDNETKAPSKVYVEPNRRITQKLFGKPADQPYWRERDWGCLSTHNDDYPMQPRLIVEMSGNKGAGRYHFDCDADAESAFNMLDAAVRGHTICKKETGE